MNLVKKQQSFYVNVLPTGRRNDYVAQDELKIMVMDWVNGMPLSSRVMTMTDVAGVAILRFYA